MIRRVAIGLALALLAVLAMLFVALNRQLFEVDLGLLRFEVSSGLALLLAFSGGLLAGALARARWVAELLSERGRLRRALRLAEGRLAAVVPAANRATAEVVAPPDGGRAENAR